jgi:hypothetical protein
MRSVKSPAPQREVSPDVGLLAVIDKVVGDELRCEILDVTGRRHHVTGSFPIAHIGVDLVDAPTPPAFIPCRVIAREGHQAMIEVASRKASEVFAVFSAALVTTRDVMVSQRQ